MSKARRSTMPRGMILLGVLLYAAALVSAVAALIVPASVLGDLPRWVLLLSALVSSMLATGLLRKRRWAWFATLSFVLINGYYLLLGASQRGQNTVFGLCLLAIVAAYLLWPNVRAAYLRRET